MLEWRKEENLGLRWEMTFWKCKDSFVSFTYGDLVMRCHVHFIFSLVEKNKTSFSFFLFTKRRTWQSQEFEKRKRNDDERWFLWQSAEGAPPHTWNMPAGPYSVCVCRNSHASHKEGTDRHQSTSDCRPSWLCVRFFLGCGKICAIHLAQTHLNIDPATETDILNIHAQIGEKKEQQQQQQTEWIRDVCSVICLFHVYSSKQKRRLVFSSFSENYS